MPRPPSQHSVDDSHTVTKSSKDIGSLSDMLDKVLAEAKSSILSELSRLPEEALQNWTCSNEAVTDSIVVDETDCAGISDNADCKQLPSASIPCDSNGHPPPPSTEIALTPAPNVRPPTTLLKEQASGNRTEGRSSSFAKKSLAVETLSAAYNLLLLSHGTSKCDVHFSAQIRAIDESSKAKAMAVFHAFVGTCRARPFLAVDGIMAVVIVLNGVVIGISADTADWSGWIVVDILFCLAFLTEFFLKMWYLGVSHDAAWKCFEAVLLVLSILEIVMYFASGGEDMFNGTSLFRMFRLLRLAKLLRICKLPVVSDLVMMINGTIGGIRTLVWSAVVISLPLYIVALILRETLGSETGIGHGAESFSTVPKAFFTIYRCVVAGDCADETGRPVFVLVSAEYGWAYGVIYAATFLFMTFGLFNVIVAIYVENTLAAAKCNELKLKENRLRDSEIFKEKSLELAMLIYSDIQGISVATILEEAIDFPTICDMEVSHNEFAKICKDPWFCDLLCDLDIAPENQKDLFDTLDSDRGGSLDVHEIIEGISKLRGDARKSDVVAVLLSVQHTTHLLNVILTILDKNTETLEQLKVARVS